ncbi:MAG: S9 family peptidase [Deltaproteobacteria bacterium]|nr:S9 family peptidase [Deltaproteobacteria bacterium]
MPRRVHLLAQVVISIFAATVLALVLLACGGTRASTEQTEPSMTPPVAKRLPHALEDHDQTRQDPYYWMRSDDRSDEEVLSHLAAENAYAEQELAPLAGFRESLFEEIVARIPKDDESVPYRLDGYWYYRRVEEGKEYPIYCRRAGTMQADEQVILDANAEAEGHDYYSAKGLTTSVNGEVLAYGEDLVSRRIYTLKFKNLTTGEMLPDEIPGTSGGAVWALDNQTVFYVKKEEGTLREYQVWRHTLGTDAAADVLVYEEEDAEFYLGISRSRSRDYVLIGSYQTLSHEYRYVDAREPTSDPVVFLPRESAHEYDIDHYDGRFYVRTNWEARDFRLMSTASAVDAGGAATADKATSWAAVRSAQGMMLRRAMPSRRAETTR